MRTLNIIGALMAISGTFLAVMVSGGTMGLADFVAGGLLLGGLALFVFARIFQKE